MANDKQKEMRKHIADYEHDIAEIKRRAGDKKAKEKVLARAEHLWDMSAQSEFGMTLEQVKAVLRDTATM